jgi:hypothetical protein
MSKYSVAGYNLADYAVCNICPEEADKLPEARFDFKIKKASKQRHHDIRVSEEVKKAIIILSDETSQKSMMSFLCAVRPYGRNVGRMAVWPEVVLVTDDQ